MCIFRFLISSPASLRDQSLQTLCLDRIVGSLPKGSFLNFSNSGIAHTAQSLKFSAFELISGPEVRTNLHLLALYRW